MGFLLGFINKFVTRGHMPKIRNSKSKWQDASNLVNKYRTELSAMLKSFTDEDRQSQNYKDLLKDIKVNACRAIRDVSPEDAGDCNDQPEKESDKVNWKSKKLWVLICSSPVLIELCKYIPDVIGYFTGTKGN